MKLLFSYLFVGLLKAKMLYTKTHKIQSKFCRRHLMDHIRSRIWLAV